MLIKKHQLQRFVVPKDAQAKVAKFDFHGQPAELRHGRVVISAITSLTSTSNHRMCTFICYHLQFNLDRSTLCLEYLFLLLKHMIDPLKLNTLPKDEAVENVVDGKVLY